jgi:hypothetical protein
MKNYSYYFIFYFILIISDTYSQNIVKGTVKDSQTKSGINKAIVKVKGTSTVATTDEKGYYQISAKISDILIFSANGYENQKLLVSNQFQVDVLLSPVNLVMVPDSLPQSIDSLEQYRLQTIGKFRLEDTFMAQNIGRNAGYDNSGLNAVNIGNKSGMYNKSYEAVNIGNKAGQYSMYNYGINIGPYAGMSNNGYANINIGFESGLSTGADNSVHIGVGAGSNDSTSNNILLGFRAGENNSEGSKVVAIGSFSGQNNRGQNLIALGEYTGQNNSGNFPIFIGYNVGSNNTGEQSIGIGYNNLMNNSGFGNSAIGFQAGLSNTTGRRNTILGTEAGMKNTTGNNNTYVGWRAGFALNGTGNTYVGESANDQSLSGDDNTIIGREAFHDNITGSYNVSIGSYSMYAAQNVKASDMVAGRTYSIKELGNPPIDFTSYGATSNLFETIFVYNGNPMPPTDVLVRNRDEEYSPVNNVAIGYMAGKYVGTGSGNVFIGANVGSDYSQFGKSNKLMIDNKNTLTPLIGGDFSTKELEIGGILKFIVQYPPSGTGVSNGSFFYGTDGALYFKGGAGTVTLIANP